MDDTATGPEDAEPIVPPLSRRPGFLFGLVLLVAAGIALVVTWPATLLAPGVWQQSLFFLAFSLFTISIGYPHPTFGHVSFDRVAQVSSILVLGPVNAAWIAGFASGFPPSRA